jgi:hypothetical protein
MSFGEKPKAFSRHNIYISLIIVVDDQMYVGQMILTESRDTLNWSQK